MLQLLRMKIDPCLTTNTVVIEIFGAWSGRVSSPAFFFFVFLQTTTDVMYIYAQKYLQESILSCVTKVCIFHISEIRNRSGIKGLKTGEISETC